MTEYRAQLYRLTFSLAAAYNIGFGVWACLWPNAFFDLMEMPRPNYPGLWQCIGMVVGLYGVLYAQAARKVDGAKLIIAIGLAGKILGPIGMFVGFASGEWPWRALTMIVFNDVIWWLPFALFLLDAMRAGERLRASAPWACAISNAVAGMAMLLVLRGGTEAVPDLAERAAYISRNAALWRAGWAMWMIAALSLVAFYAWWGARLRQRRLAIAAVIVASVGLVCDLFTESLFIGWLPHRIETIAPFGSLLTSGAANGLYTLAGVLLTVGTPGLVGVLRACAWAIWASGLALTISTVMHSVAGMVISAALLMTLLCPWMAAFGWRLRAAEKV